MAADSVFAGRHAAWRSAVARRLHEHPALAPLRTPAGFDPLFAAWVDPLARIGIALDSVLAGLGLSAADVVSPDEVEADGTWGSRHVLEPILLAGLSAEEAAVPRTELSGDSQSVLANSSIPGVSDACWRGPVARYVWDLADRQRSRWVVPFGASAEPGSPHFLDQLPLWAAGDLIPLITDWDLLKLESEG